MKTGKLLIISLLLICSRLHAQTCGTAQGDQVTYGTNDTWIGYVYDNDNFTNYYGYVTQGLSFDQSFGGDDVTYAVNGCNIRTENFSIRYKLRKTFAATTYTVTIGGDDGYRLSIDGGATWTTLQDWGGHGYTSRTGTFNFSGTVDLVIEYFDNGGGNRISFSICGVTDDPTVYGTNGVWRGYVYDNQDLTSFKGTMLEGTAANNSRIDQSFGGDDVTFYTNSCPVVSSTFSVRYRLRRAFNNENVTFLVGGDDGYRFSLNGGANWVIDNWNDHVWVNTNYTATLNGTYDMVLEYYEANGANRVTFDMNAIVLPINLLRFNGNLQNNQTHLYWTTTLNSNTEEFTIQKSTNGSTYTTAGQLKASAGINTATGVQYAFTDAVTFTGNQFYRLKMVDQNGIVTYSEVITVKNNINGELRVYPTILNAGNQLVFESTKQQENITLTITDIMGRPVMQQHLPLLNNKTTIELKNNLVKGIYMVTVKNKDGVLLNQKIVIQ